MSQEGGSSGIFTTLPGLLVGVLAAAAVIWIFNKYIKGAVPATVPKAGSTKNNNNTINNTTQEKNTAVKQGGAKGFLNREKQQVPLLEKTSVSHDTIHLRFGLPQGHCLGLPIGKHVKIHCPNPSDEERTESKKWNGRDDAETTPEIQRSYTPVSSDDDVGHFDLIIKVYKAGVKPQFPDGGKMSQYLDKLNVGDNITIQGPFGLIEYKGEGDFEYARKKLPAKKTNIGMIAGGTGITPMLQLVRAILEKESNPQTKLSLVFANQTESDILVRDRLEDLEKRFPGRFHLWYTLDNANPGWKYSTGFINKDMISAHLPEPAEDSLVLLCGPPPMIKFACEPNLEALGFKKTDYLACCLRR
eukprot:TRINITY_DN1183_c0_g6_i1.p1 TRINITY_DN1183_c0_g6~~TRINITY_DN1183_c0_g6_i1.p1  ORF type:complete len:375 (-),score=125.16 TRINITY_DN1183_c0_g6_i1:1115-2191(-)